MWCGICWDVNGVFVPGINEEHILSATQIFKLTRKTGAGALQQVCVAGIGTAGCRVIDRIGGSGVHGATFAALHTNRSILEASEVQTRIPLGDEAACAGGCGGVVERGRKALEKDIEMVRGLISDCQALILVAGLGGGTATGGLPVLLQAAKGAGVFTAVMLTMPFAFEGEGRRRVADEGLRTIVPLADFTATISNDALVGGGDKQMEKAMDHALDGLAAGVCSLWQILAMPSLLALDQGDLRALHLLGDTACSFAFGMATGETRATDAAKSLLDQFPDMAERVRTGNGVLACVCASRDLKISEVDDALSPLQSGVPDSSVLRAGVVMHDSWRDRVFLSVFTVDARRKVAPVIRESGGRGKKTKGKQHVANRASQEELRLEGATVPGQGRFGRTKATILDGEDLDIPTYVRRNITLDR